MDCREVMELMPHRFPFLLVDKVLKKENGPNADNRMGQKIVVLKNVTVNEPFFPGHFPDMPIMPGVLQIEAMAQAACLAYIRKGDPKMDFFIASVQDAKFRRPVVPGDTLIMTAEIIKDRGSMIVIRTQASVDGNVVSEANLMAKVALKKARS